MTVRRAAAAVLLLLLGALAALGGVLVHGRWWGLALTWALLVAALVALPPGWWARLAFAAGWVAVLGWALAPRPEGDFLVAGTAQGYGVLASGLLAAVWGIGTLPRRGRNRGELGGAS
ncbi:hypothetical protein [Nocardioides solisilvae]|uniref:hypothetical protein n=1 Tax=Nocardioides solisilvae TaxID=1542435 RepID=UPI0013A5BB33|nr:hypothetical protein [Nocardioides solisilvae]